MPYSNKILSKNSLKEFAASCISENQSLVLCNGHFNVIHPGHMRFLHHAKEHGDKLIVALMSNAILEANNEGHRFFSEKERATAVSALECVDNVIVLHELDLDSLIEILPPLTFVMGKEFEVERRNDVSSNIDAVTEKGGTVIFHSGEISYSSSDLFHNNASNLQKDKNQMFAGVCKRLNIGSKALSGIIDNFNSQEILVLGDTIVDQFVACDAVGMSAEAPVIVLKELEDNQYIGGAAIVAAHVKTLGAKCSFVSVIGDDVPGEFVENELKSQNIDAHLFTDSERPTTYKVRYMVENQKMFRVSRLEEKSIPINLEVKVIEKLVELIPGMDGVIISDFVYGMVTPNILKAVVDTAKEHDVRLFGDLQCSSQIGNVLKFQEFDLISPTEREARIALSDHDSGIEKIAMKLLKQSSSKSLIVTLGSNGFIAYHNFDGTGVESQHFPALCANPIDVAGAGDTLLSAIALGKCAGAGFMESVALGACAASIAVNRIGNIPVALQELKAYTKEILGSASNQ